MMAWCPDCRAYHFAADKHYPVWEANVISWPGQTDEDAEWQSLHAKNAEDAAILAAEDYDSGEYTLLRGGDITVEVRLKDTPQEVVRFKCSGESVPQYYAEEIKKK